MARLGGEVGTGTPTTVRALELGDQPHPGPNGKMAGPRRRRRHFVRWFLIVVLLVLLAGLGVLGWHTRAVVLDVMNEAALGRDNLLAGVQALKSTQSPTPATVAAARVDFKAAEVHFWRADGILRGSRLMKAGARVPWVSTQISAASDLTDLGIHASRAGQLGATALASVLTDGPKGSASAEDPGHKVLRILDGLDPQFKQITAELDAVKHDRAQIPSTGLHPTLAKAVHELDSRFDVVAVTSLLEGVRTDEQAVRLLLGENGPHTYLTLQQDPAELRGTGGFIGSVGFLSFDHGKMLPFQPQPVESIDWKSWPTVHALGGPGTPSHVDAPFPLQHIFHLQSWELRDANWSPDFPTSAQEAEFLLNRETGRKVDGVIALDPYLIERVLQITGPIRIPETGDLIDQNNFYALTLKHVELTQSTNRKDILAQASKQILDSVTSFPVSKWYSLLQAMQWGCQTRSLQVYFHDPQIQSMVNRQGCGGQVKPPAGDGLMIVEANVGGQKDDFFMKRRYHLQVALRPDGSARHTLQLHYDGLTDHGFLLTGRWGYTGWLRLYLPPDTTVVSTGSVKLDPTMELGHKVLQGWFYVQFDHSTDITVVYDQPASVTGATQHSLNLYWQKQAGRFADPITIELSVPPGWTLQSTQLGSTPTPGAKIVSDLSVDREISYVLKHS